MSVDDKELHKTIAAQQVESFREMAIYSENILATLISSSELIEQLDKESLVQHFDTIEESIQRIKKYISEGDSK